MRCILTPSASGTFFSLDNDNIDARDGFADTISVLACLRHSFAVDVTRGTAARVQDMAVDIGTWVVVVVEW